MRRSVAVKQAGAILFRRCLITLSILMPVGVLLGFTTPYWLPRLYVYLNVSQPPQHADVIVVLGGGYGHREPYAVRLYDEGYASHILESGEPGQNMDRGLTIIHESNIPDSSITINTHATSTYDEAVHILPILLQTNTHSILLDTDDFHSRRALATFRHVFQGSNIAISIVSPASPIDPASWWTTAYKNPVLEEYVKMVYYFFAHGIWSW